MPRETITLHSAGPYYFGRFLLYLVLFLGPLALTALLEDQLPPSARPNWGGIITVTLLPLVYGALYLALRRANARSQDFILLVILFFLVVGGSGWYRVITEGNVSQWPSAILGTVYVIGFSLLIARAGRAERRARERLAAGEREAMIDIQAEAILRAQELQRQRQG